MELHHPGIDVDAYSTARRPAVTLTFDIQNLLKSSVGQDKYSL